MKRTTRLVAGIAASTVLGATATVLMSPAAFAAPGDLGFISVNPTTGTTAERPTFTTSADCPTGTAYYNALLNGPSGSNWTGQTVLGSTDYTPGGGPFSVQLADTFAGLAASNSANYTAAGSYLVKVQCLDATTTPLSEGVAKLVFNGAGTSYTAVDAPATTTTLSATPASSSSGQAVNLVATVASAVSGFAGSVSFSYVNGGGSPVSLGSAAVSSGQASMSVSTLPTGSNTVTATFVPDNAASPTHAFQGSSGTAVATVSQPTTATTLAINPAGPKYESTPITLLCSTAGNATNGAPTGSAVFTYTLPGASSGTTSSPVAVSGGSASLPLGTLSRGTLTASCAYTPAGGSPYAASSAVEENATIEGVDPNKVGTEFLRTTVDAGALTLAVQGFVPPSPTTATGTPVASPDYPYTPGGTPTNVVVLPNANVDSTGTVIITSGNIIPVLVTDTRAGDYGYNVTGQLSDFTGSTAGNAINAGNLGWTPAFLSYNRFASAHSAADAHLVEGPVVAPGNGLLPADSPGSNGLAASKTLYTAPAGYGTGTVTYGAKVALKAPTTTKPDTYTATLTLTANATP